MNDPQSTLIPLVVELSNRQLAAYNSADIDAFCACYHPEVVVMDADGSVTCRGLEAFRQRYQKLFADCQQVRAEIVARMTLGTTVVELEHYQRQLPGSDSLERGQVLVRYTERDGLIAQAQFIRP